MGHLTPYAGAMLLALLVAARADAATQEPTLAIIQAAYEREASKGDPRHDKNLQIVTLECSTGKIAQEYLCWVSFTSRTDATQTLYFDVAAVAETPEGWVLKSGLCRR